MSSSGASAGIGVGDPGAKGKAPLYKRRRRRNYAIAAGVLVVVLAAILVPVLTSGGGSEPSFTISTSQGTVANSDSIILSDKQLAATVPATLHFVPFEAGVTAVAELKSGTVQAISGVGNPPATEAIGDGIGITVVLAQSFDADQLLVPDSVSTARQLVGKTVGVLVGSSEDYELTGWLALEGLTGKVKLLELGSEQAVAAAYVAGKIDAAYVYGGFAAQVEAKGAHSLIDAEQIANLGVPGIDAVAVSSDLIKSDPNLIQKYVCAEVTATKDLTGPSADKYLAESAGIQGVPANEIGPATKAYPFIPLDQQLKWLGPAADDVNSPLVKAYAQTGQFLVQQGRLAVAPTTAEIATHVDPAFVKNALNGDC
jgi:ABC-type taurine transport system substrate-binding protein